MSTEGHSPESPQIDSNSRIDRKLFVVVIVLLLILCGFLITNLYLQWSNYDTGIEASVSSIPVNHLALLTYSRAMDFAFIKTSTIFIGFILVFLGALYLLRASEAAYSLEAKSGEHYLTFSTASPGLALATLGVITVGLTIYKDSAISLGSGEPNGLVLNVQPMAKADLDRLTRSIKFVPGTLDLSEEGQKNFDKLCEYIKYYNYEPNFEVGGDPGTSPENSIAMGQRRSDKLLRLVNEQCMPVESTTRVGTATSIGEEAAPPQSTTSPSRTKTSN
ncbi:hypothetical protein [Mariprofundus ferrooxydans]|uniref:hypothetical protein n=1 Tax=Mariprofundus ferrooxydans TaxID=314344 RepID=UPI0014307CDA|nr:hypothetical protein [Mariprofundus ferrooxydans]